VILLAETAVYNVRLDIRALATLHKYYTSKGIEFKSVSSMTRRIIETQANAAISELGAQTFASVETAVSYLEERGLMRALKRGRSSIVRELQAETILKEGLDPGYLNRKGTSTINPDQYEAAKAILRDKEKERTEGAILGLKPGEIKGGD
jgi:hypothetical protein